MKFTCSKCPATWTGLNMCHCQACGNTFSVVAHFDAHRSNGKCLNPATLQTRVRKTDPLTARLKLNAHGVWVGAIPNPKFEDT